MLRTTNFILIPVTRMAENMPSHFTSRYGKLNPETERLNMRTWQELIDDESYKHGHGGTTELNINGEAYNLVSIHLCPQMNDYSYEAAFKMGEGKQAPEGLVLNWQEAEDYLQLYGSTEI